MFARGTAALAQTLRKSWSDKMGSNENEDDGRSLKAVISVTEVAIKALALVGILLVLIVGLSVAVLALRSSCKLI